MRIEDELSRALAREHPPEGFAGRVAARIESAAGRPAGMPVERRRLIGMGWAVAMAATIAIGTGASLYYTEQQRHIAEAARVRPEAERLRNDAVTGLRIASAKLNDVNERLLRLSRQNERTR